MNSSSICVFGEVLYDIFPQGERVLGGAPFNVAWHLQAFGARPLFVSRVGDDPLGREIRHKMIAWGMDTSGLQQDSLHRTGEVRVILEANEPRYEIVDQRAYDYIHDRYLPPVAPDWLYHGTLAVRNPESRQALDRLRANGQCRILLDVNLRPPWWQIDQVLELVAGASWVKLNEHELTALAREDGPLTDKAVGFRQAHGLEGLVVTLGAQGAMAVDALDEVVEAPPVRAVQLVDTVGAGDAFASVLLLGLSREWPLPLTLERAQAFAGQLVARRGATVDESAFYAPYRHDWIL